MAIVTCARTTFDHIHAAAMTRALKKAWMALEVAYEPGSLAAKNGKELLASFILEVASEGIRDEQQICDEALRRLPPVVSYHAKLPTVEAEQSRC